MASFLFDSPSSAGRDLDTYHHAYRDTWSFAFAGDKWQVSPKLTVNLGLRWEFYPPGTPHFAGGFSNYDPYANELVVAGVGGNPMNLGMQTRYKYFAPRPGIAYRLTDKTVIRNGFGIGYTPFQDNTCAYTTSAAAGANAYGPSVLADGVSPTAFQAGFPAPVAIDIPSIGMITPPERSPVRPFSRYPRTLRTPTGSRGTSPCSGPFQGTSPWIRPASGTTACACPTSTT
jgi:outer membrane receptor protein involved in Fe transport